jgi:Zn-dependent protease
VAAATELARVDSLLNNLDSLLIQFVVLLFALSIHEASHAWTADYLGDYTARYLGRVSLNPMAHIDLVGTVIFPLLQIAAHLPLIGWAKPVPVNPAHLGRPARDQVLVSLAGPGANLAAGTLAFVVLCGLKLASVEAGAVLDLMVHTQAVPHHGTALAPIVGLLYYALVINLALALFNFVPIPPLDGHWLLYAVLPQPAARLLERGSAVGLVLLYLLMFAGAFSFIFVPIRAVLGLLVAI